MTANNYESIVFVNGNGFVKEINFLPNPKEAKNKENYIGIEYTLIFQQAKAFDLQDMQHDNFIFSLAVINLLVKKFGFDNMAIQTRTKIQPSSETLQFDIKALQENIND